MNRFELFSYRSIRSPWIGPLMRGRGKGTSSYLQDDFSGHERSINDDIIAIEYPWLVRHKAIIIIETARKDFPKSRWMQADMSPEIRTRLCVFEKTENLQPEISNRHRIPFGAPGQGSNLSTGELRTHCSTAELRAHYSPIVARAARQIARASVRASPLACSILPHLIKRAIQSP